MCTGIRCALSDECSSVATGIDRRHRPERSPGRDDRGLRLVLFLLADPRVGDFETREALLNLMVVVGPIFGSHYRREPPEPPTL